MIQNKDLLKLINENKNAGQLIKKYLEYKKKEGYRFNLKSKSRALQYFIKYKEVGKCIYGPTTFGTLTNISFNHLIETIKIYLIFTSKTKININYPTPFWDFDIKLYNFFLEKKYTNYYGAIHEIEYMPELILSMVKDDNKIIGVQHGFGYYELCKIPAAVAELEFYSKFYSWIIGENKIQQTRYSVLNKLIGNLSSTFSKYELNWVLSANLTDFNAKIYGDYYYHPSSEHIKKINQEISVPARVFPHPVGDKHYKIINYKKYKIARRPHWIISDRQITILDTVNQTILYYLIHYEIPFIVIIENKLYLSASKDFKTILDAMLRLKIAYIEEYDILKNINKGLRDHLVNQIRKFKIEIGYYSIKNIINYEK